jgi:phosphatidylglycerol---prolipoprotein diacylglyceryl transferase
MRRVLFNFGKLPVYSYPAMLYLGIVAGIYTQRYSAPLFGLEAARVEVATLLLLLPALAGARLLFVASHWRTYVRDRSRIWLSTEGGAAMYGGLLLAVPISIPLLAALHLPFGRFWDVASFTMLTGMIVARVGCLLNGCCSGRETSGWLGIELPDHHGIRKRRVPTQILEIGWGLMVSAGALGLLKVPTFPGAIFLYTLGAYGAGRILLEPTRERQDGLLGIGLHRVLSTALVAVSLAAFFWLR